MININKCFKQLCKNFGIIKDESPSSWLTSLVDCQDTIADTYQVRYRPVRIGYLSTSCSSTSTTTSYTDCTNYSNYTTS